MLDAAALLEVARILCAGPPAPDDARLRRAASTAYYAVFHTVLGQAAVRFMGPGHEATAGYRMLYRSFEHARLRTVCEALDKPELTETYKQLLGRPQVSSNMRAFASTFMVLQTIRHRADYDPAYQLNQTDVFEILAAAAFAITEFQSADAVEQADVLALMMVKPRA